MLLLLLLPLGVVGPREDTAVLAMLVNPGIPPNPSSPRIDPDVRPFELEEFIISACPYTGIWMLSVIGAGFKFKFKPEVGFECEGCIYESRVA